MDLEDQQEMMFKFLKVLLLIALFLIFSKTYTYFHEFSHATTCELQGYESNVNWGKTHTKCPSIKEAGASGKTLYFLAPYLTGFVIVLFFAYTNFIEEHPILVLVPTAPVFDMFFNLVPSFAVKTDFTRLWMIEGNFFIPVLYIALLVPLFLIYMYRVLLPNKDKISDYFRNL